MYKRLPFLIIFTAFFYIFQACSLENNTNNPKTLPDITVLGRDVNSVFQVNILQGTSIANFNLTQTLGVPVNSRLMDLHNFDTTFGYYFSPPNNDNYTVWDKNINTDRGLVYNNFCNETALETPYFPQVSDNYITVFTAELVSTGNRVLNLRIYDKTLDLCFKTSIGITDQFQQPTRLIAGNSILTYHFDNGGQTVITKLSLATGAIEGQLTFDTSGAATTRDGSLYFYPSSGEVSQMEYNLETLQFVRSSNFNTPPFLGEGLFKTAAFNIGILIDRNYIQPFQFTTFPALLDQDTGEISKLADLGVISTNLISDLETDLAVETSQFYTVDLDKNVMIGSYILFNFDVSIIQYGVYYADFSGAILGTFPIDFNADKIIIH